MKNFDDFNFDEKISRVLKEIQYEKPTAIQMQAIPKIFEGLDLIASADTGTGKTGAFMLPILHLLEKDSIEKLKGKPTTKYIGPRALILVPTRELALQVSEEAKKYSKYLPYLKTVCIYGGVPYPVQKRALSSRYDILVATPGRLIDCLERKNINLSNIQIMVLDEADRMLDMGFIEPVEWIVKATPSNRQTLLFSATIDGRVASFSKKLQKNPFVIKVDAANVDKPNIENHLYYVDDLEHKKRLLHHILGTFEINQAIVFVSTISQTDKLVSYLKENEYSSEALHGDMHQGQRTRTINKLRRGAIQILVATDVAARGIDILTLSHVINFDLPFRAEDFIHRIGRTGRAGGKGMALTFATYREEIMLSKINRLIGQPLKAFQIEGLEPKQKEKRNPAPRRPQNRFGNKNRPRRRQ